MEELNLKLAPLNNKNIFNYLKFFADVLNNGNEEDIKVSKRILKVLASGVAYHNYMKDKLSKIQEEINYGRHI